MPWQDYILYEVTDMKKMRISVEFIDDDGEIIVKTANERGVPFLEEIEAKGFRDAFNDIEIAALELTKETRDTAVAEYLAEASKKKRSQPDSQEASSSKRRI